MTQFEFTLENDQKTDAIEAQVKRCPSGALQFMRSAAEPSPHD